MLITIFKKLMFCFVRKTTLNWEVLLRIYLIYLVKVVVYKLFKLLNKKCIHF